MKKLLYLLAFNAFSLALSAQSGAKIEFTAKDNTIDYGTISKEKDNGVRTFEFRNTGDQPLMVTNVQSTGGLVISSRPSGPVAPGKTGKIEVKYNMSPGMFRKTITVESNAVNYPGGIVPLKVKGEVASK